MRSLEPRPTTLRWPFAVVMVCALVSPALAHRVGLSRGEYSGRQESASVDATLSLARADALVVLPSLDADGDGAVSEAEVRAASTALATAILGAVRAESAGARCAPSSASADPAEMDGVTIRGGWTCDGAPESVRLTLGFLDMLPFGHRHLARVGGAEAVTWASHPVLDVPLGATAPAPPPGFGAMVRLGVEHILVGADHLLFLLALLLVGGTVRSLVAVVTSFTVAHSLTLAAATLGLVAPSPSLVEPLIALSIIYVGVENRLATAVSRRHLVTFVFGLIHGFGFAGALHEMALPADAVPLALLGFNLGVEAGQLAVVLLVVPLLSLARRATWFTPRLAPALSLGVAAVGVYWFVERVT